MGFPDYVSGIHSRVSDRYVEVLAIHRYIIYHCLQSMIHDV